MNLYSLALQCHLFVIFCDIYLLFRTTSDLIGKVDTKLLSKRSIGKVDTI